MKRHTAQWVNKAEEDVDAARGLAALTPPRRTPHPARVAAVIADRANTHPESGPANSDGRLRGWDEPSQTFYMLYAYPKNEQEDLTAQQLRVLRRVVREEFG